MVHILPGKDPGFGGQHKSATGKNCERGEWNMEAGGGRGGVGYHPLCPPSVFLFIFFNYSLLIIFVWGGVWGGD